MGGPVLAPAFLGCLLLLFGSSFAAYATADAMTAGALALTPIQIGQFLNGNVIAGQQNVGKALGLGMVIIIAAVMIVYAAAAEGGAMAAVIEYRAGRGAAGARPAPAGQAAAAVRRCGAGSSWCSPASTS